MPAGAPAEGKMRRIPTCLILDFHDSYTRNVLKLVEQVPGWNLANWTQRVVVVNVDSLSWDSFLTSVLPHIDCIVLGPGPGTPHRASDFSWPTRLIAELGDRIPIFGLCLGLQGLATVFGGKVVEAVAPKHGQISRIRPVHDASCRGRLFDGMPDVFDAVQYNSLVVDPASLPKTLRVSAWTEEVVGERQPEIMALHHEDRPLYGVQFHPESISSTFGPTLLSNFFHIVENFHAATRQGEVEASDLPQHILALSTAYRPIPALPLVNGAPSGVNYAIRRAELAVSPGWTTRQVFEEVGKGASSLGDIWLESARPSGTPQWSHICLPQSTWSYSRRDRVVRQRHEQRTPREHHIAPDSSFSTWLSDLQDSISTRADVNPAPRPSVPLGFIGSIGYEMREETMPLSASRASSETDESPAVELAFAARVISYEHDRGTWTATGLIRTDDSAEEDDERDSPISSTHFGVDEVEWQNWVDAVSARLLRPPPASSAHSAAPLPVAFQPDQDREGYMTSIGSARRSIIAGDAYELCLTTQLRSTLPADSPLLADPYPLYLTLRATNPAPYCAYFHLPHSDFSLLSSSPERFMRIRDGHADMKPIKGTVRRTPDDPVEDERRRQALLADEKERAENLMIVDLIRNDMLASCPVETVEVPGLMRIESYQTVHQMVTTVVGQLGRGVRPFEAMMRAFPPGSMTGAPKLRSLQLLDELERHHRRGAYAGVFGYLAIDGSSDWSVVIRTLVKRGQHLTLGAGGAITHKSDPEKEWEEVLIKVHAVLGRSLLPN